MKHTAERLSHHRILFLGLLDNHESQFGYLHKSKKKKWDRRLFYISNLKIYFLGPAIPSIRWHDSV